MQELFSELASNVEIGDQILTHFLKPANHPKREFLKNPRQPWEFESLTTCLVQQVVLQARQTVHEAGRPGPCRLFDRLWDCKGVSG
jgi:hypothetical protein